MKYRVTLQITVDVEADDVVNAEYQARAYIDNFQADVADVQLLSDDGCQKSLFD